MNAIAPRKAGVVANGAALVLLITASAWSEPIDETKPASGEGSVEISNVSGSVTVTGWDRNEIHVTGTLGEGTERLDFEVTGERALIEVVLPKRAHNVDDTDLEIRVPRRSRLDVESVSAWIEIGEVEGRLHLESVSGDIKISGRPQEIRAESVSGLIDVNAETAESHLESVSGDVNLRGARGDVEAASVSGEVDVVGDEFTAAQFETVSGNIQFEGRITGDGIFGFESHSGDIRLILGADIDAEFDVSTFSGSIDSEFEERLRRGKFGPSEELRFTLGKGDAGVSVSTFSGDIELLKTGARGEREKTRRD